MKKLLLFFAAFLLLASCSNDDTNPDAPSGGKYFVSYTVNGKKEADASSIISSFMEDLSASYGNGYHILFNTGWGMRLQKHPLTTGTYTWDSDRNNNVLELQVVSFYDDQTKDSYTYYGNGRSKLTLTITSVTSKDVRGTFSGNIYCSTLKSEKNFVITEGTFYLPIEKE